MSTLSELSRTYLEFIEDIHAGERALGDDIGRLLAEVGAGRDKTVISATSLEQRWEEMGGAVFTLRLSWDIRAGWPRLDIEAKADSNLFDTVFLRGCGLSQPIHSALLADAMAEVSRVWEAGVATVENWLKEEETRLRLVALGVLRDISKRARTTIKPMPQVIQVEGKVSGSTSEHFPAFVQWYDVDKETRKTLYWVVAFHFKDIGTRPAGLHLVCQNGGAFPTLFEGIPQIRTYAGHPIFATWTDRLNAVVNGQENSATLADDIIQETAAIYAKFRVRLDGQGR